MSRKIRYEKMFNEAMSSELIFCGPSEKDGSYALCVGCPECGEDIQVELSPDDIMELYDELGRAKNVIEASTNLITRPCPDTTL